MVKRSLTILDNFRHKIIRKSVKYNKANITNKNGIKTTTKNPQITGK